MRLSTSGKWPNALIFFFLLAATGVAVAQEPAGKQPPVPRLFGTFAPKPGAWSEYALIEKDSGKRSKMRMAIVGQEGDSYWYEVLNEDDQSRNIIKMLVKGNPNDPDNIQRQIIKSGDGQAVEMARDFVVMGRKMAALMFEKRSGVPADAAAVRVEETGEREVKVSAGVFNAKQRKVISASGKVLATVDYSPQVFPFGVVTSDTDSTSMELLAYGSDAKSMIKEEPVPMTAPRGMPSGMPRGPSCGQTPPQQLSA